MHNPDGKDLQCQSGAFQGSRMGWRQMTHVTMTYLCNCGALLKVAGKYVMDTAFAMNDAVIDHEDVTCG
jgi:hypothetical protein